MPKPYFIFTYDNGCDATSAMFRRGKTSILKLFEEKDLIDCDKVFEEIGYSPQTIITKGIRFLLAVYGAPKKTNCFDKYGYLTIVKKNTEQETSITILSFSNIGFCSSTLVSSILYQVQT